MKAAVISGGVVSNIVKVDSEEFALERGWVLTDSASKGDAYNPSTGRFETPVPVKSESKIRTYEEALSIVISWVDDLTAKIDSGYPKIIVDNFEAEARAAQAFIGGIATQEQTNLLQAYGGAKGITIEEQANAVLRKAKVRSDVVASILATFTKYKELLKSVSNPDEYESVIEGARIEARLTANIIGVDLEGIR